MCFWKRCFPNILYTFSAVYLGLGAEGSSLHRGTRTSFSTATSTALPGRIPWGSKARLDISTLRDVLGVPLPVGYTRREACERHPDETEPRQQMQKRAEVLLYDPSERLSKDTLWREHFGCVHQRPPHFGHHPELTNTDDNWNRNWELWFQDHHNSQVQSLYSHYVLKHETYHFYWDSCTLTWLPFSMKLPCEQVRMLRKNNYPVYKCLIIWSGRKLRL